MGINTVPQPPYSPDLAPCGFCLFPKLRGCHYERIEEMKETVTKVIDMLKQKDFHGAYSHPLLSDFFLWKLLERYNKCIADRGDYFEGDYSFICVLSIKVPIQKSLETYLMILSPAFGIECIGLIRVGFYSIWLIEKHEYGMQGELHIINSILSKRLHLMVSQLGVEVSTCMTPS